MTLVINSFFQIVIYSNPFVKYKVTGFGDGGFKESILAVHGGPGLLQLLS